MISSFSTCCKEWKCNKSGQQFGIKWAFWHLMWLFVKIFVSTAHSGSSIDYTAPPSRVIGVWHHCFAFLSVGMCVYLGSVVLIVFEGNDSRWTYCEKSCHQPLTLAGSSPSPAPSFSPSPALLCSLWMLCLHLKADGSPFCSTVLKLSPPLLLLRWG